MVLFTSRENVLLKFLKKLAGPPVCYIESNEPSLAPPFQMARQGYSLKGLSHEMDFNNVDEN